MKRTEPYERESGFRVSYLFVKYLSLFDKNTSVFNMENSSADGRFSISMSDRNDTNNKCCFDIIQASMNFFHNTNR